MPDSHVLTEAIILRTANATAQMGVSGYGGVAFQISGSFSGTLTFEATVHGSEWVPFSLTEPDNTTRVTTTTAAGVFVGSVVGFTAVRARMSSYSSGGASVLIRADVASPGSGGGGGGAGSDVNLVSVSGEAIALGQTDMAGSLPVTIASDQSAVDVNIVSGGGSGGTSSTFGAAFPNLGTALGISDPDGTMQPLAAETFDYATGASTVLVSAPGVSIPGTTGPLPVLGGNGTAAQAMRVTVASDSTGTITATSFTATNLKTQAENYQGGSAVGTGNPLQVSLANTGSNATAVLVTGAGGSFPVSGTVAVTQSTSPWMVGQSTATSLKAEVIGAGTAGTANAGVLTVQGIASMTPVQVSQATAGNLNATVVQGTATNLKAQAEAYQGGTAVGSGNPLQVTLANTGANATAVKVDGSASTQPVSGTVTVVQPTGTNLHAVIDSGTLTTVTTVSTVTAVTGITNPLPAGTNLLGRVASSDETGTVYNGTTALTPKFAVIAATLSGNNTVVAAVTSKKIRVLAYNFIANGAVNAKWQSGASGTDLTGLKYCIGNMGLSANYCPTGWFETASGVLLNLNLSAGVAVGGELVYVEV